MPSVWNFDAGTRLWQFVGNLPKGIHPDGAAFDIAAGKVIVRSSWLFSTTGQLVSDTWSFDPVTGGWENLKPKQSPPKGLCGCGAQTIVYDNKAGKIVMFGGLDVRALFDCAKNGCDTAGRDATETNDTWIYDYSSNRWTVMPRPTDANQLPSPRNSNGSPHRDSIRLSRRC